MPCLFDPPTLFFFSMFRYTCILHGISTCSPNRAIQFNSPLHIPTCHPSVFLTLNFWKQKRRASESSSELCPYPCHILPVVSSCSPELWSFSFRWFVLSCLHTLPSKKDPFCPICISVTCTLSFCWFPHALILSKDIHFNSRTYQLCMGSLLFLLSLVLRLWKCWTLWNSSSVCL